MIERILKETKWIPTLGHSVADALSLRLAHRLISRLLCRRLQMTVA